MAYLERLSRVAPFSSPRLLAGALLGAVVMAGGCSADVARFESPFFGFSDQGSGTTASVPMPSEPVRRNVGGPPASTTSDGGAYFPPPTGRPAAQSGNVRVSALPEPVPSTPPARPGAAPVRPAPVAAAPGPITAPASASGETVEVQQGDTLYAISKRHGVSVAALMSVNNLTGPALKPGQRLVLPAPTGPMAPKKPLQRETAQAPRAPAIPAAPAVAASTAAPASWDGTYTVKPGDSPYGIARAHKVSLEELSRVNAIADPRKVKPGAVLKVPGTVAGATAAAPPPLQPTPPVRVAAVTPSHVPAPPVASEAPRVIQTTTQPVLINGAGVQVPQAEEQKVAKLGETTLTDASEPARTREATGSAGVPAGKFRWPVKGKIIAGFGPRPDGTHNDGIRVSVPLGADVHAAEGGVVSYAGSELKGYGNLILIRHDNGWATAYAHNDQLLVKRGDKVKRGQVIAKSGRTGTVDQPQVHFELRQGSKPVDPSPHMEKM